MGASESKLAFKEDIFRLAGEDNIPANSEWWDKFIELPETAEDVQALWSPNDLRLLTLDTDALRPPPGKQTAPRKNVETLLYRTIRFLNVAQLGEHLDGTPIPNRNNKILNAVRILTRILPYIYQAEHLREWEQEFFWLPRMPTKMRAANGRDIVYVDGLDDGVEFKESKNDREFAPPLGATLIDCLMDYLFFPTLTLPARADGSLKPTRTVWQSGIGSNRGSGMTKEHEKAALEVLRLLLVLASRSMYIPPNIVAETDINPLTYMTTEMDREIVLPLLCSLLNTVLKYNANTWTSLPIDLSGGSRDPKQVLVTYSLQFLLVLITYPVPTFKGPDGKETAPANEIRKALGRLHRAEHFQFLVEGLRQILMQPAQGTLIPLPRLSSSAVPIASETLSLFWELLQCNKRFRSYLIDTGRSVDFVILVLYFAVDGKENPAKQNVLRMCVFILQTLSIEERFGQKLNQSFLMSETLPQSLQIPKFHGSYADFLISHIHALLTSGNTALESLYPALLAIISNIAPEVQNLQRATSSKLLDVFSRFSTPAFLLANESNHTLLFPVLDAINAILEHQFSENRRFVEVLLKSRSRFEALRDFTIDSGKEESTFSPPSTRTSTDTQSNTNTDDDLASLASEEPQEDHETSASESRPLSERARGKQPISLNTSESSPHATEIVQQATLTSIQANPSFRPTPEWLHTWHPYLELHTILSLPDNVAGRPSPQPASPSHAPSQPANPSFSPHPGVGAPSPAQHARETPPLKRTGFKWTSQALGWYLSVLWGLVYAADAAMNRGSSGVWTGTGIKLFSVVSQREAVSLRSPRGAVDAAGDAIARRISNFQFGGPAAGGGAPTMREV